MFEDLKSWYRANVISRLDALENAKASYSASPEESVSSIRRIAHSLKGSGKTYGFPEISEAAARVESASDEKAMETLDDLLAILHKISADRKELQYILVIEEDPDISHLLHLILTNQNCHCQNVHTAAEAHQAIAGRRFDMIVMDLDLPDMDGRNFLVQLREDARTAVLPILVLSARTAKHFESECLVLGADAYYTKPFDPKILSAAVTSLLERAKQVSRLTQLDQMTNLPNRAAFRNYYDHAITHHSQPPVPRTMALLDIDYLRSEERR
ncbi:MAG: response regulator, partial [bacterium]|nr:response regulator [bacterium]